MARGMEGGLGLIHAEALTFALCDRMPRPEAQAAIKALCREAMISGVSLIDLIGRDYPGTDWAAEVSGPGILGQAPAEARAFAKAVEQGASPQ